MLQAIIAARSAEGRTTPNPPVGAVIVCSQKIVGSGSTQMSGQDHAEIVALKESGNKANGAEMYVTLEPCSTHGRTPPCVDAIIAAGISKVHIAVVDPNPNENGNGIEELKKAGIEVIMWSQDELVSQARELIESYSKYILTGMPFLTLKYAMSIDGKIATSTGKSKWISGKQSRQVVHRLRYISDAIIVGIETVLIDNPALTARDDNGGQLDQQPLRVVIDTNGRIPVDAKLINDEGSTLIACSKMEPNKQKTLESKGVFVEKITKHKDGIDLTEIIDILKTKGIVSILIEGGSRIAGSLIDLGLIDKFVIFIAPIVIGGCSSLGPVSGSGIDNVSEALQFKTTQFQKYGDDFVIIGYP